MSVLARPHRLLVALVAFVSVWANAQTLQLGPVPPAPPLPAKNAVSGLVEVLQEEVRTIEAKHDDDETAKTCNATRARLRRMALDLLIRGAEAGPPRDGYAMQGLRLADVRRRIDVLLAGLADGSLTVGDPPRPLGVRERDLATRRLRRFVELAPQAFATASFDNPDQVEAAIANATSWLCDGIATLEGKSPVSLTTGWPTAEELTAAGALASANVGARASEPDPCDPALRAGASAALASAIAERCAKSEAVDAAAIAVALELASTAAQCAWMSDAERATIDDDAVRLARGDDRMLPLRSAQSTLLSAERRLAATKSAKDLDRAALEATLRRALFPESSPDVALRDDPARLARAVQRVGEAVELAARFRAESEQPDKAPRELRTTRRDFEKAYRRAETTTFARLSALLTDPDAMSDPELVSLVSAQREALADLDRLDRSGAIIEAIGGARPQAAKLVTGHVRTMLKWLLEPTRRAAGLVAFDALSRQVALFSPLPFEDALRRETPEATALSAGEPRKLCDAIDLARAEWADAWAAGEGGGDAARRMANLYRLTRTMAAFAAGMTAPESRDAAATLARWGGFHASRSSLAPALVDLSATTKLAALAAIARDDATLARELDRIERDAPLARFVGRMLDELGPWLDKRPTGATGALAAVRVPPTEASWGLKLKPTLAAIARFARELDFARRNGELEREKALVEYLAALSGSALEQLGAERSLVPVLPQLVEPATPAQRRDRK
ncbi:MAG: hypothetical protein U0572_02295 [Phycisphaerales bacterium]